MKQQNNKVQSRRRLRRHVLEQILHKSLIIVDDMFINLTLRKEDLYFAPYSKLDQRKLANYMLRAFYTK